MHLYAGINRSLSVLVVFPPITGWLCVLKVVAVLLTSLLLKSRGYLDGVILELYGVSHHSVNKTALMRIVMRILIRMACVLTLIL